jgi:amino acid transporter
VEIMTPPALPRRLIGRFDATMLVVGSMLAVWLLAGLLTLLAANACAELATMFSLAGGPYVFFSEAYGPLLGFLYGWTTVLVIQTGTIAAVAVAFSQSAWTNVTFPGAEVAEPGRTFPRALLLGIPVFLARQGRGRAR